MEVQLGALSVAVAEPYSIMFRNQIKNQLRSMGGMNITLAPRDGNPRLCSSAYTCGFTAVGGKELLIQNVHRSMVTPILVFGVFNCLYKHHNECHPLAHGHIFQCEGIAYKRWRRQIGLKQPSSRLARRGNRLGAVIRASRVQYSTHHHGWYDVSRCTR
eukprot:scaffold144201_cov55-Attheya_sp.AAC.2